MSQFIFVRSKLKNTQNQKKKLELACKSYASNFPAGTKYEVFELEKGYTGIVNPSSFHFKTDLAACFGFLFEDEPDWKIPFSKKPDGNYTIIRSDENHIEVVSDIVGSRTVWYYSDDGIFIASSSQQMIINYLNSFDFNDSVIPWVLATGNIGPGNSWDCRIKKAHPNGSVYLNTEEWTVNEEFEAIECSPVDMPISYWKEQMTRVHDEIHTKISKLLSPEWALPLSGGYDSRSILIFLERHKENLSNLKTITWGTKESLDFPNSDVGVAKQLSNHFDLPHRYYLTDTDEEDLTSLLEKYFRLSEGRIDHFTGYLDGFKLWEDLKNDGIKVILRGDTPFQSIPVYSDLSVRTMNGLTLCSDYQNLSQLAEKFNLPEQNIPAKFKRRDGETLDSWNSRLRLNNNLQTVIASLTFLKLGYVEQVSPLLSKKIIKLFIQMPDDLRRRKSFYKDFVEQLSPPIPFSDRDSVPLNRTVLEEPRYAEFLKNSLLSTNREQPFSVQFLEEVAAGIKFSQAPSKIKITKHIIKTLQIYTPFFIKRMIRSHFKPKTLHPNLLAFRVYMIIKMNQILKEDANKVDH